MFFLDNPKNQIFKMSEFINSIYEKNKLENNKINAPTRIVLPAPDVYRC